MAIYDKNKPGLLRKVIGAFSSKPKQEYAFEEHAKPVQKVVLVSRQKQVPMKHYLFEGTKELGTNVFAVYLESGRFVAHARGKTPHEAVGKVIARFGLPITTRLKVVKIPETVLQKRRAEPNNAMIAFRAIY